MSRARRDVPEGTATIEQLLGEKPECVCSAPGRVNLIGEYTDVNEGFVLPFAIPQRTRVSAVRRGDRRLTVRSLQRPEQAPIELHLDTSARPPAWAAYPLGIARALEEAGVAIDGASIVIESDVPIGAGLSSSAALECAVGLALCELAGTALEPIELALVAQRAENVSVGVPCGILDQAASMCCTAGNALLLDTRDLSMRQVPFPLEVHDLSVLVVDTGVKHALGESAYAERRRSCEQAARILGVNALRDVTDAEADAALDKLATAAGDVVMRRARHVFGEQRRVLAVVERLQTGDLAAVGPLLVEGHRSLRDDFEVSCRELDAVVDTAMAAGALGARMTGAGFGGSAIALAETRAVEEIVAAVLRTFTEHGYTRPVPFVVTPSAGACRER